VYDLSRAHWRGASTVSREASTVEERWRRLGVVERSAKFVGFDRSHEEHRVGWVGVSVMVSRDGSA
jgi:hypothetical protein